MKDVVRKITRKFRLEIRRIDVARKDVVSLKPEGVSNGNVLLSYTLNPFILAGDDRFDIKHTCDWECWQIAKIFLDLGYSVDVINYYDRTFIPEKKYAFFIDELTNLERISPMLDRDCIKIMHIVWAHWLFNNHASYKRCLDLQQRKGATVTGMSQRIIEPNLAIEYADYATLLGNSFTLNTYLYVKKPIFRIPISTCAIYPIPQDKDYDSCRKSFLWFGSGGLVHKGLDLVLDAFAEMPDCHLYICGPIQNEKVFERLFYKELYGTPNIHTVGWVNVKSQEFKDILNRCIGIIYPSCSEGQAGSVINCLHAGLIPIISYESGIDVGDFGIILKDCSIDEIKQSIESISNLPAGKLKQMARGAWEYARMNHTRERFAEEYKKVITQIIEVHRDKKEIT